MSIGYFGYAKLGGPTASPGGQYPAILLLTNTGGLNREINPIRSEAVWGAGWFTGAQHTNYADSQMQFTGALNFELQGGLPTIWNLITDWLVNQRVYPQSMIVSPNGLAIQSFQADPNPNGNTRGGVWLNSAAFNVDPTASIKLNCNVIGLQRTESYSASTYRARSGKGGIPGVPPNTTGTPASGFGVPTLPLNPAPINRNPFPGWLAQAQVNLWPANYPAGAGWPGGAPPNYSPTNPTGMFMMGSDWTFNNNTQVIRGCTGDPNPAAVMQGVMSVEGTMRLFRDGVLPDPYAYQFPPVAPFTASTTSVIMYLGGPPGTGSGGTNPTIQFGHVLLISEEFAIAGQNEPVPRTFGFAGLGDGIAPPMAMMYT